MHKSIVSLSASLMLFSLLAGCGRPDTVPTAATVSTRNTATQVSAASTAKTTPASTTAKAENNAQIALKPVSKEAVASQAELIKQSRAKETTTAAPSTTVYTAEELAELRKLDAEAQTKIAEEDAKYNQELMAENSFSTQSVDGGKDVSIEMFLYHPKYSDRAKFWGIKTANDFLQAGRTPWRRWLLKKKLEGLLSPKGFDQQILFWVEQADLLRIKGVSRDDAFLLVANGVTSVPDLARYNNVISVGALKISMGLMAFTYGFDAPSTRDIESWVDEAKNLPVVIY
jgi:predicted small lipoprotein YifL